MAEESENAMHPQCEPHSEDHVGADEAVQAKLSIARRGAWVTKLCILISIILFIILAMQPQPPSLESFSKVGYRTGREIWSGAYWALLSNSFIHTDFMYLVISIWMLWIMGTRIELAIGSTRYLIFIIISSIIASSVELAVSNDTGIGVGAILYAMIGFMWIAGKRHPNSCLIKDPKFYWIAFATMSCFLLLTIFGITQYANAGALFSFLFGCAVGTAIGRERKHPLRKRISIALAILMVGIAMVPLFYCPWSLSWLGMKAYSAVDRDDYQTAIVYYSRMIQQDPENVWAYLNRSAAYSYLDMMEKSRADLKKVSVIESRADESN